MLEITYVSRASSELKADDIFRIVEASARNNLGAELTGFLIYGRNRFFQLLEGPPASIDALLARLVQDRRHSGLAVRTRRHINVRSFPRWQMRRLLADSGVLEELRKEARGNCLDVCVSEGVRDFMVDTVSAG